MKCENLSYSSITLNCTDVREFFGCLVNELYGTYGG